MVILLSSLRPTTSTTVKEWYSLSLKDSDTSQPLSVATVCHSLWALERAISASNIITILLIHVFIKPTWRATQVESGTTQAIDKSRLQIIKTGNIDKFVGQTQAQIRTTMFSFTGRASLVSVKIKWAAVIKQICEQAARVYKRRTLVLASLSLLISQDLFGGERLKLAPK